MWSNSNFSLIEFCGLLSGGGGGGGAGAIWEVQEGLLFPILFMGEAPLGPCLYCLLLGPGIPGFFYGGGGGGGWHWLESQKVVLKLFFWGGGWYQVTLGAMEVPPLPHPFLTP